MLVVVVCLIFGPKLSYKLRPVTNYKLRQALDPHPYPVLAVLWKALVLLLTHHLMLGV